MTISMGILGIDFYDPYHGIVIEGDNIDVATGHYPCDEGQKFYTIDKGKKIIYKLIKFEYYPCRDKLVSHVVMLNVKTNIERKDGILYFLECLKNKRLRFYLTSEVRTFNKKSY